MECKKHNWMLVEKIELNNMEPPYAEYYFVCPDCETGKEIKIYWKD